MIPNLKKLLIKQNIHQAISNIAKGTTKPEIGGFCQKKTPQQLQQGTNKPRALTKQFQYVAKLLELCRLTIANLSASPELLLTLSSALNSTSATTST